MVKVQVLPLFFIAAVLAGEGIPLENILPGQLDLFLGNAVKQHQHNHARDADTEADGVVGVLPLVALAGLLPATEVKGAEILPVPVHHLRMAHVKEAEGPPD